MKSVIEIVLKIIGNFWKRTIGVSPSAHKYFNLIRKWNILKIEHEEKSTLKKHNDSCTLASQQLWWLKSKTRESSMEACRRIFSLSVNTVVISQIKRNRCTNKNKTIYEVDHLDSLTLRKAQ